MKILIKNGLIIDGTGSPGYKADLLINGDKIERISEEISVEDAEIIDASNRIVSPGFIDIHSHADFNIYDVNKSEPFVMQGITTSLMGVCGLGVAPATKKVEGYYADFGKKILSIEPKLFSTMQDFFEKLEKKGVSINCAFLIPQGNVRLCIMGLDMSPATDDELEKMKHIIKRDMISGAFGLSTGLVYPPGSATPTEELIELSKVVAKYNGIYDSHMRNEGAHILDIGMAEVIRIAEEAKVKAHISHWSVISKYGFEKLTTNAIKLIKDAHDKGLKISVDVVPYDDGATSLPFVILESWVFEDLINNLTKSETRKQIKNEIFKRIYSMFLAGAPWYLKIIPKFLIKRLMIPILAKQVTLLNTLSSEFNGKTLFEALKTCSPDKNMLDALLDFIRNEEGSILIRIKFKDEEKSVIRLLNEPYACISSDSIFIPNSNNHPRVFGAFAHLLERDVREKGWIGLEESIRKVTSLPASILGISDRGVLKTGNFADVVVFDYNNLHETATLANGNQHPKGIDYVIINGHITVEKGEHSGVLKGHILKHKSI